MFTLLINLLGILLLVFIIAWFWLIKPKAKTISNADNLIDIVVANGVYSPAIIKIPQQKLIQLRFLREDASPCAEWVIFPALNLSQQLPLNKPHIIEMPATLVAGEYEFMCQMGMYRGRLIVQ